jgi:hypothetical protein
MRDGDLTKCLGAGRTLDRQRSQRDRARAERVTGRLSLHCGLGSGEACEVLAGMTDDLWFLERGCLQGRASACHDRGTTPGADPRWLELGCALGLESSCLDGSRALALAGAVDRQVRLLTFVAAQGVAWGDRALRSLRSAGVIPMVPDDPGLVCSWAWTRRPRRGELVVAVRYEAALVVATFDGLTWHEHTEARPLGCAARVALDRDARVIEVGPDGSVRRDEGGWSLLPVPDRDWFDPAQAAVRVPDAAVLTHQEVDPWVTEPLQIRQAGRHTWTRSWPLPAVDVEADEVAVAHGADGTLAVAWAVVAAEPSVGDVSVAVATRRPGARWQRTPAEARAAASASLGTVAVSDEGRVTVLWPTSRSRVEAWSVEGRSLSPLPDPGVPARSALGHDGSSRPVLAWADARPGQIRLLGLRNGAWEGLPSVDLAGSATDLRVRSAPERIVVGWTERARDGSTQVRVARADGEGWSVHTIGDSGRE